MTRSFYFTLQHHLANSGFSLTQLDFLEMIGQLVAIGMYDHAIIVIIIISIIIIIIIIIIHSFRII